MSIYLDNDFESEFSVTRKNATSGAEEAATGLTGLLHYLAATKSGSAIHADLSKTSTERSGKLGTYYAIFEGDDLRAQLAADYIGQTIYEIFGDGTNVLGWRGHKVFETRPV